jgi:quercetin dioxygenase-like cupin family protein
MSGLRPRFVRNEREGVQMAATTDAQDEPVSTPAGDHVYLQTHQVSGDVLRFLLSFEGSRLHEVAASSPSGRAGKTLVKEGSLRIVQMALKEGVGLSSHDVDGAVSVQILRGRLQMRTAGGAMDLTPGALVVLDASVRHSATAMSDCELLITISLREEELR